MPCFAPHRMPNVHSPGSHAGLLPAKHMREVSRQRPHIESVQAEKTRCVRLHIRIADQRNAFYGGSVPMTGQNFENVSQSHNIHPHESNISSASHDSTYHHNAEALPTTPNSGTTPCLASSGVDQPTCSFFKQPTDPTLGCVGK